MAISSRAFLCQGCRKRLYNKVDAKCETCGAMICSDCVGRYGHLPLGSHTIRSREIRPPERRAL